MNLPDEAQDSPVWPVQQVLLNQCCNVLLDKITIGLDTPLRGIQCKLIKISALLLAGALASQAQVLLEVASAIQGIMVIGPNDTRFPDMVGQALSTTEKDALQPAFPVSVIVSNQGSRTVVFYVVKYDFVNRRGQSVVGTQSRDYRSTEPQLRPGSFHIVTPSGRFTQAVAKRTLGAIQDKPGYAADLQKLDEVAHAQRVSITLDAALYDNGDFVGPDTSNSFKFLERERLQFDVLLTELRKLDKAATEVVIAKLDALAAEPVEMEGIRVLNKSQGLIALLRHKLTTEGRPAFDGVLTSLQSNPLLRPVRRVDQ